MDLGVHVWSTPLGYCDDDTDTLGCIKDEEEVSDELGAGFLDPSDPSAVDPLNLAGDPLSIEATDVTPTCGDPLAASDPTGDSVRPDNDAAAKSGAPLVAGPSSIVSVLDESSAESADSHDPATAMWFKAEPEDASALTSDRAEDDPPAWASGAGEGDEDPDYPPSPDPALPLNLVDPESGRELFTCKVCRSTYKQKMMLQAHYKNVHPGYRPFKCDICGNRYFKEGFVRSHRKLHTGERDYVCDACGRGFVSQARLTAHLKTARYCPASTNVDRDALERKLNNEAALSWLEAKSLGNAKRRRTDRDVVRGGIAASAVQVLIDVPDSP